MVVDFITITNAYACSLCCLLHEFYYCRSRSIMKSPNIKHSKRSCRKSTPRKKRVYQKYVSNSMYNIRKPKNGLTELEKITVILAFTFL